MNGKFSDLKQEIKAECYRQHFTDGMSYREIAAWCGVNFNTIRRWVLEIKTAKEASHDKD